MSKKIDPDIEQKIVTLYSTQNPDGTWTGNKTLAEQFGVSPQTVLNVLSRNSIRTRDAKESHSGGKACKPVKNLPPEGEVPPLCKCGCGLPVIWNQRKNRWNVYVEGHYREDAEYKDPIWLRHQYVDLFRSADAISRDFGVNATVIRKFMRKFGIEPRTTGETLILNGSNKGANNPAWKGGIAKWSYAHNWKRIARIIRKRDNYTCQICKVQFPKSSKLLHVHHKDGDKFNNDPDNLVVVCATCHPKGKRKENGTI